VLPTILQIFLLFWTKNFATGTIHSNGGIFIVFEWIDSVHAVLIVHTMFASSLHKPCQVLQRKCWNISFQVKKKCTIGLPFRYLGCSAAAAARSVVLNRPCSGQRERERASCNFKYLQRGGWGREGLAIELDPSFRKLKSRSGNTWDPPYLYVYILFTTLLYECSCKWKFVL
jgi:hypothetical protein